MLFTCHVLLLALLIPINGNESGKRRQKRYLVFTPATQYGAFATISIPLPEPNNLVSVAWFFEANYFTVDNATYYEPLLGGAEISRKRSISNMKQTEMLTRTLLYTSIETTLQNRGYPGRGCLLRAICQTATSHFSHNGLVGDLLHLFLTPSSSLDEKGIQDCYFEAEYRGLEQDCGKYSKKCPYNILEDFSMYIDHLL